MADDPTMPHYETAADRMFLESGMADKFVQMPTDPGCTELTCPQHGAANRAAFYESNQEAPDGRD